MSYQLLDLDDVAKYLHLTPDDVAQRVKRNEIPHQKRGNRVVFSKDEIDLWASQRVLSLPEKRLTAYHEKTTRGTRELLPNQAILPDMIQPASIDPAMWSKTKSSVLHRLVVLAEATGKLNNPEALLESLEAREVLCSTGMPGGFALPHPRVHEPYLFESSFIILGRTIQQIHFGAPDGESTDLFFLICCRDDRLHLHTLARLSMIAMNTDIMNQLRQAPDAVTMRGVLLSAEEQVLAGMRKTT